MIKFLETRKLACRRIGKYFADLSDAQEVRQWNKNETLRRSKMDKPRWCTKRQVIKKQGPQTIYNVKINNAVTFTCKVDEHDEQDPNQAKDNYTVTYEVLSV